MHFTIKSATLFLISLAIVVLSTLDAHATAKSPLQFNGYEMPKQKAWQSFSKSPAKAKIEWQEGLSGTQTYIVQLKDKPVATYRGDIAGLESTAPGFAQSYDQRKKMVFKNNTQQRASLKLDLKSQAVTKYRSYLKRQQENSLQLISQKIGYTPKVISKLQLAFNGVVLRLSQEEARQIANLENVLYVEREQRLQLDTDRGPTHIGAPNVWSGVATGSEHLGEGVIVGIIDSGINTDHPSFAATAGDGYVHINPFGAGNYVGDCAVNFPELCNSKLIGVRSYPTITDFYDDTAIFPDPVLPKNGEDYDGHGTHVASTAAGNILLNVPLVSPEVGVEESDGLIGSSFQFSQISGVAPRANIIAYQVCAPGTSDDTYSGCFNTPMLQSVDDAIADGVDVLNMSISGGGNPWTYSMSQAFLGAQEAGIFVAISAGNSGPQPETTVKNAPWYTSVAAATHGRNLTFSKQIRDFTGGDTTPPGIISGSGNTVGVTAPIVYAGDFDNPNDAPDADSAQCLEPFPADTFSGQIVLCDRGAIARVAKAENVAAGGAGGYVLANVQGGATNLANDVYVVPGIQVTADNGDAIKTWLATGTDHTATITGSTVEVTEGTADQLAGFSSRGPNVTVADVMMPTVTAPGVSIYAAYADQQFGHDVSGPAPSDYNFLQGTSMSSPHVAGAGALLKSVHPTWTPDNIRSALMMTANRAVLMEDGTTQATIFDMGAGRIQVDAASKAGLVMNETAVNYQAANPAVGGDPKTLNIPSMGNTQCESQCAWSRTLTATRNSDWTISTVSDNANIDFTVSPSTFSVTEGDTQMIEITASSTNASTGDQASGWVTLTSNNPDIPDMTMPVFVTVFTSNLPQMLDIDVNRDAGSMLLTAIQGIAITDFNAEVSGLQKAVSTDIQLQQDSDNSSPFDDTTDGVSQLNINLTEDSPMLWADLINTIAQDMDLFIGRDDNADGIADEAELLCASTSSTSSEECMITDVTAGSYWVLVHNFTASTPDATNAVTLRTAFVPSTENGNLTVTGPVAVARSTPFDVRLSWDDDMTEGDVFVGAFSLLTDASPEAASLGQAIIKLTRDVDDVQVGFSEIQPRTNERITITVDVIPNLSTENIDYQIDLTVPTGLTIDPATIVTSDGSLTTSSDVADGVQLSWSPSRDANDPSLNTYIQSTSIDDATCAVPNFGHGGGYLNLADFGINPISVYGDEVTANINLPFRFLGVDYETFTVSDNGLLTFGTLPSFEHQKMPSVASPNNLVAPFWRDMQLDEASGSGISIATAGPWSIVEFDAMRHWAYYNGDTTVDDVLDFQVLSDSSTGDFIFAYANVTHNIGDGLGASVGWENADGSNGEHLIYVGGLYDNGLGDTGAVTDIVDGLTVCYRSVEPSNQPLTLTFEADVEDTAAGKGLTVLLETDTSAVNTRTESSYDVIVVQSNLNIIAPNETFSVDEDTTLTGVTLTYTDNDTVANNVTITSDQGVATNIVVTNSNITFDVTPNTDFFGELSLMVTVTDSVNPDDSVNRLVPVTINPVNDEPTVNPTASGSATVTLTANANDVDGNLLTYSWVQTGGPAVTITNDTSAIATVSNANATSGTLSFEVTVSDGTVSVTGAASITVTAPPPTTGGGGGGGSPTTWLLMLLFAASILRRQQK